MIDLVAGSPVIRGATPELSTIETVAGDLLEATALHHHPRSEQEVEVSTGLVQTEKRSDGTSARVVTTRR